MKALTNWLCDPCVHLIVIALILFRLATMSGSEPRPEERGASGALCKVCRQTHDAFSRCRVATLKPLAVRTTSD